MYELVTVNVGIGDDGSEGGLFRVGLDAELACFIPYDGQLRAIYMEAARRLHRRLAEPCWEACAYVRLQPTLEGNNR